MTEWFWWGKQELGQMRYTMVDMEKKLGEVWVGMQEVHIGAVELTQEIAALRNILAEQNATMRRFGEGSSVWDWSQGM